MSKCNLWDPFTSEMIEHFSAHYTRRTKNAKSVIGTKRHRWNVKHYLVWKKFHERQKHRTKWLLLKVLHRINKWPVTPKYRCYAGPNHNRNGENMNFFSHFHFFPGTWGYLLVLGSGFGSRVQFLRINVQMNWSHLFALPGVWLCTSYLRYSQGWCTAEKI